MVLKKKAISPVVATALLLVVAVVAVVGFQTWFNAYQSGINTKVSQESEATAALVIDRVERNASNGIVYIRNQGVSATNISSIKVITDTATCTLNNETTLTSGVNLIGVTCDTSMTEKESANIVVVGKSSVPEATLLVK